MALNSAIVGATLSSISKTKWIEVVVAPIAARVSQLIILSEKAERSNIAIPDMLDVVNSFVSTCKNLEANAVTSISTSDDSELKADMRNACEKLKTIEQNLLNAAHTLVRDPHSQSGLANLVTNFRELLESVIKVLVTTDASKIRQIVFAANQLMNYVTLVEECDTMQKLTKALVDFTTIVRLLLDLVNKRQKELINKTCRETLVRSLKTMQENAVILSRLMQSQIASGLNEEGKTNKEYAAGQIRVACADIIRTVQRRQDGPSPDDDESGEFIFCLDKIRQLLTDAFSPSTRSINGELDLYVSCIIRASMKVARLSREKRRDDIVEQAEKVLHVRNELNDNGTAADRGLFDMRSERLLMELHDLMITVKEVTTYHIVDTLADTNSSIELLLYDRRSGIPSNYTVTKNENNFQNIAERILEVANCASFFGDSICVQRIRVAAKALEKLTRDVLTTSRMLRVNPSDKRLYTQLENVCNNWMERLTQMVTAVDKIVDVIKFLKISEVEIYSNIRQCQDGLRSQEKDIVAKYANHAGKCLERAMDLVRSVELPDLDNRYYQKVENIGAEIESIIPQLKITLSAVISDIKDYDRQQQFLDITNRILETMRELCAIFIPQFAGSNQEDSSRRDRAPSNYTDDSPRRLPDRNLVSSQLPNSEVNARGPPSRYHTRNISNQPTSRLSPSFGHSNMAKPRSTNDQDLYDDRSKDDSKSISSQNETIEYDYLYKNIISEIGDADEVMASAAPKVFASPISRLVDASVNGEDISGICSLISDASKKFLVIQTIMELRKLAPQVISAAQLAVVNRNRREITDQLRVRGQDWSFKMQVLAADVDKFIDGWSTPATRVAATAHLGNAEVLNNHIDAFHTYVMKLQQIAVSTITAAEEELSLTFGSSFDLEVDHHSQLLKKHIMLIRQHIDSVNSTMKLLISTAKTLHLHLSENSMPESFLIQLEILRREWGVEVKSLMEAFDGIIKGTVAPVEALISAAQLGDRRAVHERAKTLNTYRNVLKEISTTSISSCDEVKKIESFRSNMQAIERLTHEIMDLAWIAVETSGSQKTSREGSAHQASSERLTLLQREWASKVHLLSAVVDDLTADVSSPVDNLAGAALAISKSYGGNHGMQLLQSFQVQADTLTARVARVKKYANAAVANSKKEEQVKLIHVTSNSVEKLTPKVISAARGLAENPDQLSVEWFQLVRRQWASKACLLIHKLDRIEDVNFAAVSSTVQELFGLKYDMNAQQGPPRASANTIQAPLPTYPQQTLPMARSSNIVTETNEPYSRLSDLKPSSVALSQPNLATTSYTTNRPERPYSAMSQNYDQPYNKPQSAFSPNPNTIFNTYTSNVVFNPHQQAAGVSVLNSARNLMSDQPPLQSVFNRSEHQSVNSNYDNSLLNNGMNTATATFSSVNPKQRLESQATDSVHIGITSTSMYPSSNVNSMTDSSNANAEAQRLDTASVGSSNNTKPTIPSTQFRQAENIGGYLSSLRNLSKGTSDSSNDYFTSKISQLPSDTLGEDDKNVLTTKLQASTQLEPMGSSKIDTERNNFGKASDSKRFSELKVKGYMHAINDTSTKATDNTRLSSNVRQEPPESFLNNKGVKKSVNLNSSDHVSDGKVKNFLARSVVNNRIKLTFEMQEDINVWEEDGNFVIRAAKEMANRVDQLTSIAERPSSTVSAHTMAVSAKNIAENAVLIGKFMQHMSNICTDKGNQEELRLCADQIQTISMQLKMLCTVNENLSHSLSNDHPLIENSKNLNYVVMKGLKVTEAACLKIDLDANASPDDPVIRLAMDWRKKLCSQRNEEAMSAQTGAFGLRRVSRSVSPDPTLTDLVR
ncbi:Vinculin [Trichoplax sp. H2]|nr:Vinculin [Trichoplax sp. H2]|eukprot:RDD41967.1 Vinculin [Trichoplax sp. H2]